MWDYYEFNISTAYLPALINDDYSGLNDEDIIILNEWLSDICELDGVKDNVGYWAYDNDYESDFRRDDVTGLYADTMPIKYMFKVKKD